MPRLQDDKEAGWERKLAKQAEVLAELQARAVRQEEAIAKLKVDNAENHLVLVDKENEINKSRDVNARAAFLLSEKEKRLVALEQANVHHIQAESAAAAFYRADEGHDQ